jgi:modulator of FtsH protease HflC
MDPRTRNIALIGLLLAAILFISSVFVVNETQRAIVLRLGKIITVAKGQPRVLGPGLHFKAPFIDSVRYLDKRIQSLEISSSRIPTEEKKELIVDLFTKWRIVDFSKFYTSTGGNRGKAEKLLKEKIVDGLRAEIGRRNLNDVVAQERQNIMDKIRIDANNKTAKPLGIEVVDARIVRIDLPQEVSEAVFNLMRTERNRVASEHRAKGRSKAEAIRADADARVIILGATAGRQASEMKGEGDAKASEIYASVYSQDPEFYSFYRSLEAYRETFNNKNDMLVIKPDDAFFKYFRKSHPSRKN